MKPTYTKTIDGGRWLLNQRHRDNFTVADYQNSPIVYTLTPQKRCTTDTGAVYFAYGHEMTFDTLDARTAFMRCNHASVIYSVNRLSTRRESNEL